MITAEVVVTKPAAGVITTRPATMPEQKPSTVGLLRVTHSSAAQVKPLRDLLLRKVPQGSGPDESRREKTWFTVDFVAEAGGDTLHTRVSGGDPGYTETAKMLSEAALALAFDDLPETAGQVTTAVAMGDALLTRLQKAGLRFEVL